MKVTLKWLQQFVDIDRPVSEIGDKLTMAGLEVADMKTLGGWKNVVVGQIAAVNPHPNADRLRLATVDLGGRQQTVVCGAPNLTVGDKIAFASVGAELVDGHSGERAVLKPAKIRGVQSEGMICSEMELGISDDHTGILVLPADAPVGKDLSEYLGDTILDIEVTPNRPDCLSVTGIAREIAALTKSRLHFPPVEYKESEKPIESFINIEILDPGLCPRYCASLLTGVKIGPSPDWMQQRLMACGMRPINNVVDVTNYVMLEYGQPLHAFDYRQIGDKKIIVRRAEPCEKIITLDGLERELNTDILVIADGKRAVAVAGIMGGEGSGVMDSTSMVLIESANFNQAVIHSGSNTLKLSSEASLRFAKGLSAELAMVALKRATQLMQELSGADVARGVVDVYPGLKEKQRVAVSTSEVKRLLGVEIEQKQMVDILESLGFKCEVGSSTNKVMVEVPWWRTDVTCAADLVEEVARIIGYDNLPTTMLSSSLPVGETATTLPLRENIRQTMVSCGFQEVLTYSLTGADIMQKLSPDLQYEGPEPLRIAHPMSRELVCLRTELRSGILMTLARNQRFQQKNMRLFELGKVFLRRKGDLPEEKDILCAIISGDQEELFWRGKEEKIDFFIVKGIVETLLSRLGLSVNFKSGNDVTFLPHKNAVVMVNNEPVGVIGELHPKVTNAFDVAESAFLLELDIAKLLPLIKVSYDFRAPARYPGVTRDIALIVDESVVYQQISGIINSFSLVSRVTLFDLYRGEQIAAGKKSLAFRIIYQSQEQTLTDAEVDKVHRNILDRLASEFGASLRS